MVGDAYPDYLERLRVNYPRHRSDRRAFENSDRGKATSKRKFDLREIRSEVVYVNKAHRC